MSTEKTFQELKAELDEVLLWFESDEIELEKIVSNFKKAQELLSKLENKLSAAEVAVHKLL